MKNDDVLLYLQAKDQEQYEDIISVLNTYARIPTSKIHYDSENLRVNLDLTYAELQGKRHALLRTHS